MKGLRQRFSYMPLHAALTLAYTVVVGLLALIVGGIFTLVSARTVESIARDAAIHEARQTAGIIADALVLEADASLRARTILAKTVIAGLIASGAERAVAQQDAVRFLQAGGSATGPYFFVLDSSGTVLIHPDESLIGATPEDPVIDMLLAGTDDFVRYRWQNPWEDGPRLKTGYPVYLPEWDWHLVGTDYAEGALARLPADTIERILQNVTRGNVEAAALFGPDGTTLATTGAWDAEYRFSAATVAPALALEGRRAVDFRYLASANLAPGDTGTVEPGAGVAIVYDSPALRELYRRYAIVVVVSLAIVIVLVAGLSRIASRLVTTPIRNFARRFAQRLGPEDPARAVLETADELRGLVLGQLRTLVRLDYERHGRRAVEDQLMISESVFNHTTEGICVTDSDGRILRVNPAFEKITGYEAAEVLGRNPRILKSARHEPEFYEDMWHRLRTHGSWVGEIWNSRKSGEIYPELLSIQAVSRSEAEIDTYVAVFHDISDIKATQDRLHHLATHDPLTGLPNRTYLSEVLAHTLERAQRDQTATAVIFLDVDNFKDVNDSLGHHAGDQMLTWLARRIEYQLRRQDIVARFGGDEFVIVLPKVSGADDVSLVARRLLAAVREPYSLSSQRIRPSVSIGIAVRRPGAAEDSSDSADAAATLLRDADAAMYEAKRSGKNDYSFHDPAMNESAHRRIAMQGVVGAALDNEEFELVYQPIVCPRGLRVCGAEALIRWRRDGELLSPDEFLPYVEKSSVIMRIDSWVVATVGRMLTSLGDRLGEGFAVSVNASAFGIAQPEFADRLERAVADTGIDTRHIRIEVTETAAVRNYERARRTLESLRAAGFRLYLDDFGSGYASIRYLREFGVDAVKLDSSYLMEVEQSESARSLVTGFLQLAKGLGLVTVVEGVETQGQLEFLAQAGADMVQGYFLGRPGPFDVNWLERPAEHIGRPNRGGA